MVSQAKRAVKTLEDEDWYKDGKKLYIDVHQSMLKLNERIDEVKGLKDEYSTLNSKITGFE